MDPRLTNYFALPRRRRRGLPSATKRSVAALIAAVAAAIALGITGVFGLALASYRSITDTLAPLGEQISVRQTGITTVWDRNGEPLGVLSNPNSAITAPVSLDQISPLLLAATISTEDNGFWGHDGFDLKGLVRAAWSNYVADGATTGGSTITQQLVKSAYFTTDCDEVNGLTQCSAPRTIDRKLKELAMAVDTEEKYPKDQILVWYLNSISYAGRYVGAEAASQGYFDKAAADLTLSEAALLAGVPAAPTLYDPRENCLPDASGACVRDDLGRTVLAGHAKQRQESVLDLMAKHGHLTQQQADDAKSETVHVSPDTTDNRASAFIDSQVEPRLVRMCEAGVLSRREGTRDCVESVHTAGYRVTTTLDWQLNSQASELLNRYLSAGLAAGCDCHNGSVVTIEPATGEIVVYVPNLDPTWVSDPRVAGNIDQITEIHQPGSSFKPAVYLSWMDGLAKTPLSSLWDTNPMNLIDKPAKPEDQVTIFNPGRNTTASQGLITARAALGGSQNVPAFRAATEAGVENVISMAKALGITTLDNGFDPTFRSHPDVIYGAAIATGGANVRLVDMAYMNVTIANMGVMVGVPTYASTLEVKDALSVSTAKGDEAQERALKQRDAFLHGYLRLPGTRSLDPVVVLKVESADGTLLYQLGDDLVRKPVVNAGSVWMLHSIMSDCTARFLIWQCGSSNDDLSLDFFVNGVKIPGGVKTGTQQAATAAGTLETWMTGYSRYAATAVWVGNADKSPVRDGPEANYASGNATVRLFKNWMGAYHAHLQGTGAFETPASFDDLRPDNVAFRPFFSASTERGQRGGCYSPVNGWQRTDIAYRGGDCQTSAGSACVALPTFKRELALTLAFTRNIPACGLGLSSTGAPAPTPSPVTEPDEAAPTVQPTVPVRPTVAPAQPATQPPPSPARTPRPAETANPPTAGSNTPIPQATSSPQPQPQETALAGAR